MQATHLKNLVNGRIFLRTEALAARKDLMPCDAAGKVIGTFLDAGPAIAARQATRFLGNPANGRLLDYTEALAERSDLISVDTIEQWDAYQEQNIPIGVEQSEDVSAEPSALGGEDAVDSEDVIAAWEKRHEEAIEAPFSPVAVAPQITSDGIPAVFGLPGNEARTLLRTWAKAKGVDIDYKLPLNVIHSRCLEIARQQAA